MKKKSVFIIVFVVFLAILSLLIIPLKTTFYVGHANPTEEYIDIKITLNKEIIFNEKTTYQMFNNIKVQKKLRIGFYDLEVYSEKKNISLKKNIFILFNRHIYISYYPEASNENTPCFTIDTSSKPILFQ
ncbi:MAG: hypothetical protein LUG18_03080 [Candidatus Azobacteroides sp.]|nr:hypothetical protein [Candidatus Azobacteroides sp.]